ncbi:hypothetical protein [Oryzifoliimicrobium ureilyticus]|uniref:hypothetical protein n=1 Tax=Oryzifoliimicrobium ureilyticus TaxID=3113724 RepID=UPI0030767CD2
MFTLRSGLLFSVTAAIGLLPVVSAQARDGYGVFRHHRHDLKTLYSNPSEIGSHRTSLRTEDDVPLGETNSSVVTIRFVGDTPKPVRSLDAPIAPKAKIIDAVHTSGCQYEAGVCVIRP